MGKKKGYIGCKPRLILSSMCSSAKNTGVRRQSVLWVVELINSKTGAVLIGF